MKMNYIEEMLKKPFQILRRINRLNERLEYAVAMSFSIPGPCYGGIKVQHMRNLDAPFVKWIEKEMEIKAEINEMNALLIEARDEINRTVIGSVDDPLAIAVMISYYCEGKTYEEIESTMNLERRKISALKHKAIKQMEDKYDRDRNTA